MELSALAQYILEHHSPSVSGGQEGVAPSAATPPLDVADPTPLIGFEDIERALRTLKSSPELGPLYGGQPS